MSRISTLYLLAYNSFQAIGWAISLTKIFIKGTYASAGNLISILQCAAFLEVIHGAIGIVPSGGFASSYAMWRKDALCACNCSET
ncbi:hypothetical protein GLYMA_12G066150v4 [Glycine max]|nr:hypothetical protein GLYMA_12G066150v4 [Glycine max]